VVENCGVNSTYILNGPDATYIAEGDLHEPKYSKMGVSATFWEVDEGSAYCTHALYLFPTSELKNKFTSNDPIAYTAIVSFLFGISIFLFVVYDKYITERQTKVEHKASKTDAIVSQLFPGQLRDMVIQNEDKVGGEGKELERADASGFFGVQGSKAMADFFPESTIMMADLAGFTAWSSIREPSQVFDLLESIFQAFDTIARQRGIFKVETVGDCYVAVAGVPKYRRDHAIAMARFARSCSKAFKETLRAL